jgi:tRNA threonylcarbamoyladenosine biosynthesis protein TsaE
MIDLHVVEAKPSDASDLVDIIHSAFGSRPPLDPPGTALHESVASVASAIERHGGLLATVDGEPAGTIVFGELDGRLVLRRVSVHPRFQHRGVGTAMVGCAEEVAESAGMAGISVTARVELPYTLEFWRRRGYLEVGREAEYVQFSKPLPVELSVPSADAMREFGVRLAGLLRPGDLVLLAGELGAGKTTLTQGIGAGLGVQGQVASPTFVISRVHRSASGGPPLVHVDAYRLGGVAELNDLDLDASLDDAVTVVEWGEGLAEQLAEDRLEIVLTRGLGEPLPEVEDDPRRVRVHPVGRRWAEVALRSLRVS